MAKIKTVFTCQSCGATSPKWLGKCTDCGEWNSFVEGIEEKKTASVRVSPSHSREGAIGAIRLDQVESIESERLETGIGELDRVLGGGLTKGSLVLIGGEPGIGKSTLLLSVVGSLAKKYGDSKILYVSGEESAPQIAGRAKRLGINPDNVWIMNETDWGRVKENIHIQKPRLLIIDSIQTMASPELESAPGTVSQIREVTYEIMNYVKGSGISCFIVGHITKEGNIAGPKILEHMVDTVVYFEGDTNGAFRILRSIKNRFGSTNEVGIFEMKEKGLEEVTNPSSYFVEEDLAGAYGRSLACVLEGSRPLFVEIQGLVVENKFGNGRRTTQGIDTNRLAMVVAIIEKYLGVPIGYNDIYLNIVGGLKLLSRDIDLSILAALLSSHRSRPIEEGTVLIGELGLSGEVRSVPRIEPRLKEMAQFNYKRLITSERVAKEFRGKFPVEIVGVRNVADVAKALNLL